MLIGVSKVGGGGYYFYLRNVLDITIQKKLLKMAKRIKPKPSSEWVDNWEAAIGDVPDEWIKGYERADDKLTRSKEGQANYDKQMSRKEVRDQRLVGLNDISESYMNRMAREKGVSNIETGMRAGVPAYSDQASVLESTLAGIELKDKVPDDAKANIINNVVAVGVTLQEAKRAGKFRRKKS